MAKKPPQVARKKSSLIRESAPSRLRVPPSNDPELSRQLLRAEEEERKRISRELHDETGQGLMVLRMYLQSLTSAFESGGVPEKFQEAFQLLDRTIEGLRRIIRRLSPRVLEELGLLAAVRREARELSRSTGIESTLALPETVTRLDHESEIAIYRTVQEALHNIAKHAGARHLRLDISQTRTAIRIVIEDDGIGFPTRRQSTQGLGLLGMRERIAALGGNVRIRSLPEKGTRISVTLPAHPENSIDEDDEGTTNSVKCERIHGAV
jgi:two-component system sensor histidine kinase UhpB